MLTFDIQFQFHDAVTLTNPSSIEVSIGLHFSLTRASLCVSLCEVTCASHLVSSGGLAGAEFLGGCGAPLLGALAGSPTSCTGSGGCLLFSWQVWMDWPSSQPGPHPGLPWPRIPVPAQGVKALGTWPSPCAELSFRGWCSQSRGPRVQGAAGDQHFAFPWLLGFSVT